MPSKATSSGGEHPVTTPLAARPKSFQLTAAIAAAIRAHARAESPREACGIIIGTAEAASGGVALRWEPTRNSLGSPTLYEIDATELLRISLAADDADEAIWGIVHSHVASKAEPSSTDVLVAGYPDALYLIVSLARGHAAPDSAPGIRAWWILDGEAHEVALEIS
jgi:proteasome lid subunit RPN8/RPN11